MDFKLNVMIISFSVISIILLSSLFFVATGESVEIGCMILGTEVNGDNSIEFLGVGNCYF